MAYLLLWDNEQKRTRSARDDELAAAIDTAERFSAVAPVELREVAFALGLVRGVEREESVVELEEEPPAR